LAALAITSHLLFHGVTSFWAQSALSFMFGALVSGYLFPRFITVTQRCVASEHIEQAMSFLLAMFYVPGLFAGAIFGKLVDILGWSTAAALFLLNPYLTGSIVYVDGGGALV
jgi:hypothetical protein